MNGGKHIQIPSATCEGEKQGRHILDIWGQGEIIHAGDNKTTRQLVFLNRQKRARKTSERGYVCV